MPTKKYIVCLNGEERQQLSALVSKGKAAAYKRQRAQILLQADIGEEGPDLKDHEIVQRYEIGHRTVERTRQRLVELGLTKALERTPRQQNKPRVLDGEQEAHLVALSCSEPPDGCHRWTLRLLAHTMIELSVVETVCVETVRQALKKHHQTLAA